ncbi:6425_t:CDS:2, partial [Entrophospora sp. SA101]
LVLMVSCFIDFFLDSSIQSGTRSQIITIEISGIIDDNNNKGKGIAKIVEVDKTSELEVITNN